MDETEQLRTGDHSLSTRPPEDIDLRLSQVENGLRHFEAILPAMIREVEGLRGRLGRAA